LNASARFVRIVTYRQRAAFSAFTATAASIKTTSARRSPGSEEDMPGPGTKPAFADYEPVADRVEKFYDRYPDGRINTAIVEHDAERGFILMRAEVYRLPDDALPAATGHAFELKAEGYVNKTSYIENCETGAVGRALAMLNFKTKRGVASREEMEKSDRLAQAPPREATARQPVTGSPSKPALPNQLDWIAGKVGDIAQACQKRFNIPVEQLDFETATKWIAELRAAK
jgi:hypothetical protein